MTRDKVVTGHVTRRRAAKSALSLTFLGGCQARQNDKELAFPTNVSRALLAYLASESDRPHSREMLATLLWPDQTRVAASTNFRQTLSRLRKALGDSADTVLHILPTSKSIQFNAASDNDVTHFEALLAEWAAHAHSDPHKDQSAHLIHCPDCVQRLREAMALYRGEFLHGLFVDHSAPFEEWMLLKREQLQRKALTTLEVLTRHAEARGDFAQMRHYAERQLAMEPWSELAHMQLMLALACSGQRTAAIAQFERCKRVLKDELGIEPSVEMQMLYERIRAGKCGVSSSSSTSQITVLAAATPPHNLPTSLTAFVGRERELNELMTSVREADHTERLLTLVGSGGMGKTRLAIEAARAGLDVFTDGVFFVPLTPLTSPAGIVPAIAATLTVTLQGNDPQRALCNALRARHLLLIVDNFEHVIDGAHIIAEILQSAPKCQIIATSRERLNVQGERVFILEGMAYSASPTADAQTLSSVRLFVQSARRARPNFILNDDTLPDVLRICSLVQGIPLALELAAVWTESLSLDVIAAEIETNADFLSFNWRDMPTRHRSMRSVFAWSWNLLDAAEREGFRRLCVFRGGFTREAAQKVAGASWTTLTQLVHKSLVQRGPAEHYEIHELLRQLGLEQLHAQAEECAAVEARHSEYYLAFVARHEIGLARDESPQAVAAMRDEMDNIRQAWAGSVQQARLVNLERSAYGLWQFLTLSGLSSEAEQSLQAAVECIAAVANPMTLSAAPATLKQAQTILSQLLAIYAFTLVSRSKLDQALITAQQAVTLGAAHGSAIGEAIGYLTWGQALDRQGHHVEARERVNQALQRAGHHLGMNTAAGEGLRDVEWRAHLWLGSINLTLDAYALARDHALQGYEICKRLAKVRGQMTGLYIRGGIDLETGHYEVAREACEQALELARRLKYQWGEGVTQLRLGNIFYLQQQYGPAHELIERALVIFREIGSHGFEAMTLAHLGRLMTILGDPMQARERLDQSLQLSRRVKTRQPEVEALYFLALLHHATGDEMAALRVADEGRQVAQEVGSRSRQARLWVARGHALTGLGQLAEAAAAYQQARLGFSTLGLDPSVAEVQAGLSHEADRKK